MISAVSFIDQTSAEDLVPEPAWAMISITGFNPYDLNNDADLHPDWNHVLRLEFDDVSIRGEHLHGITEEQAGLVYDTLTEVEAGVRVGKAG